MYDSARGACGVREAGILPADEEERAFPVDSRVVHRAWGEGLVLRYEADTMVVLFETVGYRTLGVDLVRDERLLWAG